MKKQLTHTGILLFLLICSAHLAQAQIINIEDKRVRARDTTAWFGNVDLGFSIFQNNGRVFTFKGGMIAEYVLQKHLFLAVNQFNLVKAEAANFVNDGFQHLRYNYRLPARWTYEAFAQVQYNERVRIRVRALLGTGLRYQLLNDVPIFLGASYMYEYEEESESKNIVRGHRLSTYVSFRYRPTEIVFLSNTSYFQPLFTNINDHRLSSQTSLVLNISNRLSFKSALSITYDTRVPQSTPRTIYNFTNGIRIFLNARD